MDGRLSEHSALRPDKRFQTGSIKKLMTFEAGASSIMALYKNKIDLPA